MGLSDRINEEMKQAMKDKAELRLGTIRMVKAAIKNFEVSPAKKGEPATDTEILSLIQKQIKQQKESRDQYVAAARKDLADKEEAEIKILESFLPKQMSEAELEALVKSVLSAQSLSSKKDFGKAMKLVQEKASGQADNRRISDLLNKLLA